MDFCFCVLNLQHIKKNRDPRWTDGRFEFVCDQPPDKNDKVRVEVWSKGSHLSMHSKVMLKNGCLYILIVNSLFKILFDDNDFFVGLEITLCQLRGILVDIKQVRGIGYLW